MKSRSAWIPALVLALAAPRAGAAQRIRTAVVPERITVGDRFRAAVRVEVSPGARVLFPDTLNVPENVEAAARAEVQVDTSTTGTVVYTAVYALTAWKPGPVDMPPTPFRVEVQGSSPTAEATFDRFLIESVLPPDSAGVEPKPVKDVLGPSRLLWPIVVGTLLLVALLVAAWIWWRRRRPAPIPGPGAPPREIALAELERIRRMGYIERGEWKPFYSAVSGVLRKYAAALDSTWGRDLTTPELGSAMEWRITGRHDGEAQPAPAGTTGVDRLIGLLGNADIVKFAAGRPERSDAEQAWSESLGWIETFEWPLAEPEPAGAKEGT